MTVKTELTELLRALLQEDFETFDRRCQDLDAKGWNGSAELISSAFLIAVDRRFQPAKDRGEIIRFVADARAQFDESGGSIDQTTGEILVRTALGEEGLLADVEQEIAVPTETILLFKLVIDLRLSEPELEDFLAEAEQLATRITE